MDELSKVVNLSYSDIDSWLPEPLDSSDFSIVSRKVVELPPREGNAFGGTQLNGPYGALNNKAVFNVSDGSGYLDWKNTYLTGSFEAIATTNADRTITACLDDGGIMSCISEIRLRVGNAEIFRQQFYNKAYNASTMPVLSESKIDFIDCKHFDSVDDFSMEAVRDVRDAINLATGPGFGPLGDVNLTAGGVIDDLATNANAPTYGNWVRRNVRVGDLVKINDVYGIVRSIGAFDNNANSQIVIAPSGAAAFTAINAGAVTSLHNMNQRPTRARVINSGAHRFSLQLNQSFCNKDFFLPLPFLLKYGPLEMELVFESAVQAIALDSGDATTNRIAYKISDLKLHMSMVYPSEGIVQKHQELYEKGAIRIPYVRYDAQQFVVNGAGVKNLSVQTNKNSIQRILGVMVPADAITESQASQVTFSQSTFNKNTLLNYQFKVGAHQFPDYGPVDASGADSWLAYDELLRALVPFDREQSRWNNASSTRIRPYKWASATSDKYIIGSAMSKDGTYFTGVSARLNNVQLSINCNPNNNTLMLFLYYDCLLSIGKQSGVLVFE